MSRILLTGATGFLGRHVAAQAVASGLTLRCTGRAAQAELPDYRAANLENATGLSELLDGVDAVIHAAGLAHQFSPKRVSQTDFARGNVVTTENVLRAAIQRGIGRFILVSSVSVYGLQESSPVSEDAPCRPESPYAKSKYAAEQVAIRYCTAAGIPLTILRLATLYGEGDPGNMRRLLEAIHNGRFVWVGSGRNQKSLIHVEDAAAACLRAVQTSTVEHGGRPEIYNISDRPRPMREIVEELERALGRRKSRMKIPRKLALSVSGILAGLTGPSSLPGRIDSALRKWCRDDAYAGNRFAEKHQFQPKVTLSEGIAREVEWFRSKAA